MTALPVGGDNFTWSRRLDTFRPLYTTTSTPFSVVPETATCAPGTIIFCFLHHFCCF